MRAEIDRHDWAALPNAFGEPALALRAALYDLSAAGGAAGVDVEAAAGAAVDLAVQRIQRETNAPEAPAPCAPAAARCLVQGLGPGPGALRGYAYGQALELLVLMSSGGDYYSDGDGGCGAARDGLRAEVSRGFDAYATCLRQGADAAARCCAVNLILVSGLYDPRLRPDAARALRAAPSGAAPPDLLAAALAELERA
ncbi:hypothetical protein [Kitasatospora sp. NPDC057198]|uniref:hypothetical protein n=1 Tax=Kitasatospora sp. NPDC057198 TaxID=3346046 RepID=UPI003625E9CF